MKVALKWIKDILLSSPQDGDVLTYQGGVWKNQQPASSGTANFDSILVDYEGNVCVDYEFNVMTGIE